MGIAHGNAAVERVSEHKIINLPSSSLARQLYVSPGLPEKLLLAKVSGYCFFRFRDKPFPEWGCQPHAQPPAILEGRCFLSGLFPLADYSQF
jgi:hypothetical protein